MKGEIMKSEKARKAIEELEEIQKKESKKGKDEVAVEIVGGVMGAAGGVCVAWVMEEVVKGVTPPIAHPVVEAGFKVGKYLAESSVVGVAMVGVQGLVVDTYQEIKGIYKMSKLKKIEKDIKEALEELKEEDEEKTE